MPSVVVAGDQTSEFGLTFLISLWQGIGRRQDIVGEFRREDFAGGVALEEFGHPAKDVTHGLPRAAHFQCFTTALKRSYTYCISSCLLGLTLRLTCRFQRYS